MSSLTDMPNDGRRAFLRQAMLTSACVASIPAWSPAAHAGVVNPSPLYPTDFWLRPRQLSMRHVSGERVQALYWSDGELIQTGWQELSQFMRDRVVDKGVFIEPVLLDILHGVNGWVQFFNLNTEIVLHSGYRDPMRNRRIEGAARNSEHTRGGAADISIPGISTAQVAKFVQWLGGGGVGFYPHKGFIHVDKGRVRTWRQ